jgi:hypothetical protein
MKTLIGGPIIKQKCSLIILLSAGLFAVCGFNVTAQAKSHRSVEGTNVSIQSAEQPARLIIHRIPNLGYNVVADFYLDGAPFGSVGYNQTFDKSLPPGRHVLSVGASPSPRFATRSDVTVNAQSGKTYVFTAEDNNSGSLVLK